MPLSFVIPGSLRSHCRALVWTASLIVAIPSPARAAENPSPLAPREQLCKALTPSEGGSSQDDVSRQAILTWLLDENWIRDAALDADGDGSTLVEEKVLALTDAGYCSSISTRCTSDDEAALSQARTKLRAFAEAGGGPGYVIERLDKAGNALPGGPGKVEPEELLDHPAKTVRVRCVALPEAPADVPPAYWHRNGDDPNGFRLAGDVDNLSKSRGSLGGVKAAQLSITSDLIEDETAYRVNAVAGYAFSIAGGDDLETSFTPFLEAERVTSGSETQIDNLGAGFQLAAKVNWPGMLRSEFAVTPIYQTDSDFESHTGTLKFRWTPAFAENAAIPLGFARTYGPVELRLGLDLLADAGRVFDEGDQGNLDGEGNFLRLGNQAALQLRGAPGNLLRQFEIQLANRYLYNVDTQFDSINQFDAALAYLFPGNENYQLSFAYSNGRDDNSLELYEFWQTQFGIRF